MTRRPIESLTDREAEMLRALWQLREIDAVAQSLRLSRNTVRSHLATARAKLGTSSSTTAARWLREAEGHLSEINPAETILTPAPDQQVDDTAIVGPPIVRDIASPTWPSPTVAVSPEGGRRLSGEPLGDWLRGTLQIAIGILALIALATFAMKLLPKVVAWNTFIFK